MSGLEPLRRFVADFTELVGEERDTHALLDRGGALLAGLVARDDWLPDSHAAPRLEGYTQYLLHLDPAARFSVVSFVWGPGQATPVHDHTIWGLVGVLRGAELSERFVVADDGLRSTGVERLERGAIDRVGPEVGDLHRVTNALPDAVSVSIHVYGADIGAVERSTYDEAGGRHGFVSGYAPAPELGL